MQIKEFDPVFTKLNQGLNLIEASAGTGKTYTIAMLVLRMVVELAIPIDKILVVTFTKAATEELKNRVRVRLVEARTQLTEANPQENSPLAEWLSRLDVSPDLIKSRLNLALLDIDRAGIFTIHGFCQRVLSEHALASGQLFDAELTNDLAGIKQACADDFWRQEIQNRPAWQTAVLTKDFKTPNALLSSISRVNTDAVIYPQEYNLDGALLVLKESAETAANRLDEAISVIEPFIEEKVFKENYKNNFICHCLRLSNWLTGKSFEVPDSEVLAVFTRSGLYESLNGNQFKATKSQTGDERKQEFLDSLAIDTKPFDALAVAFDNVTINLRRKFIDHSQKALEIQLERMNVWTFDSLISLLASALQGSQSQELADELRQQFSAALIDEFQDTDSHQWFIFSTVFAVASHYLMLVGDPKQAVYKFRGADIYSYLAAQKQAPYQHTLRSNWRSHPLLVEGVNRLFSRQNAFLLPEIAFTPATAALTADDGALCENGQAVTPFMVWQLPESDSSNGFWRHGNQASGVMEIAVVNEILELLNGSFTLQPKNTKIIANDIAILVRSNQQARDYQLALKLAGVPSVLSSTQSVFATEDATQFYILLDAVAHQGDTHRLAQALALDWFGYDGQALYDLLKDDHRIDAYLSRFAGYHQLWLEKGLMAMSQTLLQQENIVNVIIKSSFVERRLTNIQHVIELTQQAALDDHLGLHKTLAWLKKSITQVQANAESQQLRLESDADAVKIVTMHRSKGLEYPIVFCPFLWQGNNSLKEKFPFVQCHDLASDGRYYTIADLGSAEFNRYLEQAQREQQAEDVRLAYVAMTRAKYRCYLTWADVRTKELPNQSALAWLLTLGACNFTEQQVKLQRLQLDYPDIFSYRLLEMTGIANANYQPATTEGLLVAKKRSRSLYTNWQMSSYTALSALSMNEAPELPQDKANEQQYLLADTSEVLPAGAHTGNVIHELLEIIAFKELAQKSSISVLRNQACQRYGLRLTQPEIIDKLLSVIVSTPLSASDPKFCLMNLPENRCLKELPFYLSLTSANTTGINHILQNEPTFQPLSSKQINGYLTGFIDLICEYEGRYYVMDYKTNSLPNYKIETLTEAMREHNYGLQYWLYCLVLHHYLKSRLQGYAYEQHFGGVQYLFVRGMQPKVPASGVFHSYPDVAKLEALSVLFEGNYV